MEAIGPPFAASALDHKRHAVVLVEKAHQVLGSRLLGPEHTSITTTMVPLEAKRLSLHPDSAAVAVDLLTAASVRKRDHVAVNLYHGGLGDRVFQHAT